MSIRYQPDSLTRRSRRILHCREGASDLAHLPDGPSSRHYGAGRDRTRKTRTALSRSARQMSATAFFVQVEGRGRYRWQGDLSFPIRKVRKRTCLASMFAVSENPNAQTFETRGAGTVGVASTVGRIVRSPVDISCGESGDVRLFGTAHFAWPAGNHYTASGV